MRSTRIATVPASPLLLPVIGGSHADLRALQDQVDRTINWLLDGSSAGVVVVAATPAAGEWGASARWDFRGFGIEKRGGGAPALPWPLAIGAWLLEAAGWDGDRRYLGLPAATNLTVAAGLGLLLVGDGLVGASEQAPVDPVHAGIAERLHRALDRGDPAGLADVCGEVRRTRLVVEGDRLTGAGWLGWESLARSVSREQVMGHRVCASQWVDGVDVVVAEWELSPPPLAATEAAPYASERSAGETARPTGPSSMLGA